MTDSKALFVSSKWKIFIDGVEVPFQSFVVSFVTDANSSVTIEMDPDSLLLSLRAGSLVHIFARDTFRPSSDPTAQLSTVQITDSYKLYWEGFISGIAHQKSVSSRSMSVRAFGLFSIFDQFKAFSSGVGPLSYSPIISGSDLLPIYSRELLGSSVTDIFSFEMLSNLIQNEKEPGEDTPDRDSTSPKLNHKFIRLLTWLSSHNALLRQFVIRYRLLDKICSIDTLLVPGIVTAKQMGQLLLNSGTQINQEYSILDMIRHLESYMMYQYSQIPFPVTPKTSESKNKYHPMFKKLETKQYIDLHKFPKSVSRNDIIFHPEMIFTLPPPCNLVFPDQITSLTVSNAVSEQVTRLVLEDPTLTVTKMPGVMSYMAPRSLAKALQQESASISSADAYGLIVDMLNEHDAGTTSKSPYYSLTRTAGTSEVENNLLKFFTAEEFERGLVVSTGFQGYEMFVALSVALSTTADAGEEERTAVSALMRPESFAYRDYMTQMCDYLYRVRRYDTYTADVSIAGHRWLVPGFTTLIMDKDVSYLGTITAVTLSVTAEGLETTSARLTKVRPIKQFDPSELQTLIGTQLYVIEQHEKTIQNKFNELDAEYEKTQQDIQVIISGLQSAYAPLKITKVRELEDVFTRLSNQLEQANRTLTDTNNGLTDLEKKTLTQYDKIETQRLFLALLSRVLDTQAKVLSRRDLLMELDTVNDQMQSQLGQYKQLFSALVKVQKTHIDALKQVSWFDASSAGYFTDSVATIKNAIQTSRKEIDGLVEQLSDALDMPIPPSFFDHDLILLSSLDKKYERLLGCKPLYTGIYSEGLTSINTLELTNKDLLSDKDRLTAILEFFRGLLVINNIYPIFGTETATASLTPAWSAINNQTGFGQSLLRWEHETFLERQGTTLTQFSADNGLSIQPYFGTDSLAYYVLYPKDVKSVGSLAWDDTIFSKIVDDKSFVQGEPDPAVADMRKFVSDKQMKNLTTQERQQIMLAYARRHFYKKAFSGN